jgi:hypothetical protein
MMYFVYVVPMFISIRLCVCCYLVDEDPSFYVRRRKLISFFGPA